MLYVSYIAIITASVVALVFSSIYYIALNKQVQAARGQAKTKPIIMPAWKIIIELVRNFIVSLVIAYAVSLLDLVTWNQALLLAIWLWIAFPVVILAGSVIHENFSQRLAVIHAGDWLAKLLIFSFVLTLWP